MNPLAFISTLIPGVPDWVDTLIFMYLIYRFVIKKHVQKIVEMGQKAGDGVSLKEKLEKRVREQAAMEAVRQSRLSKFVAAESAGTRASDDSSFDDESEYEAWEKALEKRRTAYSDSAVYETVEPSAPATISPLSMNLPNTFAELKISAAQEGTTRGPLSDSPIMNTQGSKADTAARGGIRASLRNPQTLRHAIIAKEILEPKYQSL